MNFEPNNRSESRLIEIYKELVTPRLIEEKMLILLRQGKISKWFSGIGQEAISVGAALCMKESEYVLPMHRNLGIFTTRKIPLEKLFSQFQGKANGFTKGRDRSFHFGTQEYHLVGMISHLGPQLAVADGIALADLIQKNKKVTLVFTGDGGTSQGDFHEAVNVASVWNLPVIFVIENNGYGLSTPSNQQYNFDSFLVKGPAYGIEAVSVDGNNILEVMNELEKICESIRKHPRPVIFEAKTFRIRGHEEASGTKYVPKELMNFWVKKDPIVNYEYFLMESGIDSELLETFKKNIRKEINIAVKKAFSEVPLAVNSEKELADVYAPFTQKSEVLEITNREIRYVDAISEGLRQSLERNKNLVFLGQDIAEYGGVLKFQKDFWKNLDLYEFEILLCANRLS